MHVMMAIETRRIYSVNSKELVALSRHDVFEGPDEKRMKDCPGKWVALKVCRNFVLMFQQPGGTVRPGKPSRKVEVKAGIDSFLPGQCRGPFGILHEHHCAHGGHGSTTDALQSPLSGFVVAPPVVGVDD